MEGPLKEREQRPGNSNLPLVNEQIRYPRLQVISADGQNVGVILRYDALRMASESGLDLVIIADQGAEGVPVAKIMDFGKALYAKKKKQTAAKKHQKTIQVKEVKMRPKIGEHDFQTKLNQAIGFLKEGMRVKITVELKGREMFQGQERGKDMFERINKYMVDQGLKTVTSEAELKREIKAGQHMTRLYYLKD
jgi:translation initiation factor IF-3